MRTLGLGVLVLAAASQLGASGDGCTPGPVLMDEGFDLWCGNVLCVWKTVTAEDTIKKAPTWHSKDAGVEFVGPEAIIEQSSAFDSEDGTCIQFDMIANVEATAEMRFQLDLFSDGSIDYDERIPTSAWKPITIVIKLAAPYRGIRFQLAKRGAGRATLAQIHAERVDPSVCDGFTEIASSTPRENGAWCALGADCASNQCRAVPDNFAFGGTHLSCTGCDPAASTCGSGTVCGLADATSFVRTAPVTCVPNGADETGEQCLSDAECSSGICAQGFCSLCDAQSPCASGTCRAAYADGPLSCPGGARDAPCIVGDDCASGTCEGAARSRCFDGRACDSPADCPLMGACTAAGVTGGTCS